MSRATEIADTTIAIATLLRVAMQAGAELSNILDAAAQKGGLTEAQMRELGAARAAARAHWDAAKAAAEAADAGLAGD